MELFYVAGPCVGLLVGVVEVPFSGEAGALVLSVVSTRPVNHHSRSVQKEIAIME